MLSIRISDSWSHPLHLKVLDKYQKRTDPFWWQMIASVKNTGNKATFRNWMVRKARRSFAEALQEKGYDVTGRWVDKNKSGRNLKGTANFILTPVASQLSNEQLKNDSKLFIEMLEKKAIKDVAKAQAVPGGGPNSKKQVKTKVYY